MYSKKSMLSFLHLANGQKKVHKGQSPSKILVQKLFHFRHTALRKLNSYLINWQENAYKIRSADRRDISSLKEQRKEENCKKPRATR